MTTITYANLNGGQFFDVEILEENNEKYLLPVKQIADILDVPVEINHETKELKVNDILVSKDYVYKNSQKLSNNKNIYLKKGLMDEVKDEIFCESEVLSKIFDSKISINQSDLSVVIFTDKKFESEVEKTVENKEEKPYKIYSEIKRPRKKKNLTLDTVEFNNSMFSDTAVQIYRATRSKNSILNNAGMFKLRGEVYGGDWEANLLGNTYNDKLFSFSGMNFKYNKKFKDKYYEFGKISGFQDAESQVANGILGVQVFNYNPKRENLQRIDGEVNKDSLVNVYVNDKFHKTLSTYDGYFSLADFYCNEKIDKIEIRELMANGEEKTIFQRQYPKYKDKGFNLLEKEKRRSAFVGVSGYDDRLFAENGYLYQAGSKKFAIGAQEEFAVKENLTSTTKILYDRIITQNPDVIWGQSYYNSHSILSLGTYQNPASLDGFTVANTVNWLKNDNWRLTSDVKMSLARDISENNKKLFGYSVSLNSNYQKNNFRFNCGIYNQSPDFYLASSRYGFVSDRLGARVGLNYKYNNWNFDTNYHKYYSNLTDKISGGLIDVDEFNFNVRGKILNSIQVKYNFNTRQGVNEVGEVANYFQDLNLSKYFKNGLSLEGGERKTKYTSEVLDVKSLKNDFESDYSTIYLKAGYQIPKNKGKVELSHDITEYSTNFNLHKYNMIKMNYTFPEMKRFLISLGLGYKYTGQSRGFNYSASLGYRTKTGMILSLMYRYDTDMGYMIDNMYIPTSQRHSINFTINDTLAVVPSGLKSIGQNTDTKGFVEVKAFLDKNGNNIFDKGDVGVEDVPFKISEVEEVLYTGKNGKTQLKTLEKGVYRVTLDEENLMSNLSILKGDKYNQLALIQPKTQTEVLFKLTSSVGNIRGNLKIVDDFGRIKSIRDFIVVLHDKNDVEVAYSTIDKNGNYYFSGIAPGEYSVMLDENFRQKYNLEAYEDKGILKINIPYVYKDFVNFENQNLVYKSW